MSLPTEGQDGRWGSEGPARACVGKAHSEDWREARRTRRLEGGEKDKMLHISAMWM